MQSATAHYTCDFPLGGAVENILRCIYLTLVDTKIKIRIKKNTLKVFKLKAQLMHGLLLCGNID